MTDDIRISKVAILIQQQKFAEAEYVLKDLLSQDANNTHFMSLLAEVYLQQDKFDVARSIIDQAIGLSPNLPHLFYIKSRIALQQNKLDEAEKNLQQSIQLDPQDADYFALLAHIKLARKDYTAALDLANQALELDAENLVGLNTRSTALLKLDKKEEAFLTIEGALREDPNNAYTHANYGWGLLEKGDHKKALQHFQESLKNDPNYAYAQSGMIEALKASNPVYRLFLQYAFWIGNLTAKYQWGVIIGFYLGVKVLRGIADGSSTLSPYLTPLIIALSVIAFSTWIINPISNLFLRFNKYGQFLLSKNEKMSSNFVAVSFVLSITGLLLFFFLAEEKFLTIAAFGCAMMLPCSVMFSPSKYKYALLVYTVAMALLGILSITLTFLSGEPFNLFTNLFLFAFIAFQWVANYLRISVDD